MDKDKNSSLNMKEFKKSSKHNKTIILALLLYNGPVWFLSPLFVVVPS